MALALLLSSCGSASIPTYESVRSEALTALTTIGDIIPEPKTIRPRPEFEPYGCEDSLLGLHQNGAFFTGYWEVEVADDFDVAFFVTHLRETLGEGWRDEPSLIRVPYAQTNLIQESTGVSVTVEEAERNGKKGIDMLAMSRCGREEKPKP